MDVLLTFTGFHDPYAIGLVGQEEQPGPILSLNDKLVLDRNVGRPAGADQDVAQAKLKVGRNKVLLKITQGRGDWGVLL